MPLVCSTGCFLFIFLLAFVIKDAASCPAGYSDVRGSCLAASATPLDWDQASKACGAALGHLATAMNPAQHAALVSFRSAQAQQGDPVWIGLRSQGGSWQLYDGKPVTWSTWTSGIAPHATWGDSSCGILDKTASAMWSEWNCNVPLAYICQYTVHSLQSQEKNHWLKVYDQRQYSGTGILMTTTSLSRIQCATKCMSTSGCEAFGYRRDWQLCHVIAGDVWANQTTPSSRDEVWKKSQ